MGGVRVFVFVGGKERGGVGRGRGRLWMVGIFFVFSPVGKEREREVVSGRVFSFFFGGGGRLYRGKGGSGMRVLGV